MYKDDLIKRYKKLSNEELKRKLKHAETDLFADKITFTELGVLCFEAANRINCFESLERMKAGGENKNDK